MPTRAPRHVFVTARSRLPSHPRSLAPPPPVCRRRRAGPARPRRPRRPAYPAYPTPAASLRRLRHNTSMSSITDSDSAPMPRGYIQSLEKIISLHQTTIGVDRRSRDTFHTIATLARGKARYPRRRKARHPHFFGGRHHAPLIDSNTNTSIAPASATKNRLSAHMLAM